MQKPLIISKNFINEIYQNKYKIDYKIDIKNLFENSESLEILQFYNTILFYDITFIKEKECPIFLLKLFQSPKLITFLLEKHLEIQIQTDHLIKIIDFLFNLEININKKKSTIIFNISKNFENINYIDKINLILNDYNQTKYDFKLLKLLLNYEINFHNLSEIDIDFFKNIFQNLEKKEKLKILNSKPITPLKIFFSKFYSCSNDFYKFISLENLNIEKAFEEATNLNYKKIKKIILVSEFSYIKKYIELFYMLFPELLTFHQIVSLKRIDFIKSPFEIELNHKLLNVYTQTIENIMKWDEEKRLDFRTFYILKIINVWDKKLLKKVVNLWFCDSTKLVEKVFEKKPKILFLFDFFKYVPNLLLYFDLFLNFVKLTKDKYFSNILAEIIINQPYKNRVLLIKNNLSHFDNDFINKLSFLINNC